ncbi:ABC transporter permease [Shinella sp. 838]|jgi:simple sugar transport system permease protein|uniref:ABC transporter permease n=1 Tax=unclassified Shinella TaxID=2643062 RepID=UPI0003C564AA|nr:MULTISPECIES: ABC transporter permease [unclassified Shinella]EYR82519.1 monosaccharide ABC transporter membrane protein, CUT2 family [Shinella sp. DD12]MCA0344871.1 ABC transporter permease [Pseudomonadota bacterium]MDG4673076.1 ABC transporter permease [Shinella sp. 838]
MQKTGRQLAMLAVINGLLLVAGALISGGSFLSLFNLQSMASQVPEIGLLAIGVMLAMCAGNGGIDLSGIALANLSGVLSAVIVSSFISAAESGTAFSLAFILGALLVGLAGGIINGVLISRLNITPILCTLGTQMAFMGLAVVVSGGKAVTVGSPALLSGIGNDMIAGVPISFLVFVLVAAAVAALLKFTPYGLWLMLMGTNPKAAVYAGFPRNGVIVATYAISGLLSGLVGIIIAARNVNVKFDYGSSYLLIAILIAVMAGVKPEGGYGRVVCVVLSAIALQLMSSLLNFSGLSNFVRDFAWGLLLLTFLAVGRYDIAGFLSPGRRSPTPSVPVPQTPK